MPIYEYTCRKCETKFDKLIRTMNRDDKVPCPECGSTSTARALSVFAVGGEGGRAQAAPAPGCGRCGGPGPCAMGN